MATKDQPASETAPRGKDTPPGKTNPASVLQVERRDFVDIVPEGRDRAQPMRGFDPIYTDIVDYIVRCTHRIWDERDVGLIYTHYTHNCVVYHATGTIYNREDVVHDTIKRMFMLPERRGMATQVIWNGNEDDGFYTSHLVTGTGRHTQPGIYGKPTGRTFVARTIADCMIYENMIYREWLVVDSMAQVKQIGLDAQAYAESLARPYFEKGLLAVDMGENRRLIGQYPPETAPDTEIANTDLEREVLEWLHEIHNKRMFGKIREVYAPTVQYHGPLMKELYGHGAVTHQTVGLYATVPDGFYMPQHICSVPCEEGGTKVAVRWLIEGHHLGWGVMEEIGAPTGKRVQIMGMSHFHIKNGRIVDEWTNYDEMSVLMQIKLAQMADRDSAVLDEGDA
ncbi:ester cyclase [Mameliella sp. AT18]|uniref:nuclear transport factor 2 family protein n=1 Tax=Mameliella sp. AT18 TaxID=3028385 RepID=UPI0008410D34|nr:ester cyclase [Mameliella sp. AT18]MDD9730681.1 ester cyclase [Mameliella sp. AT18]ODM48874.1 ester cyclase [Ruegeria sp. PBVC088]